MQHHNKRYNFQPEIIHVWNLFYGLPAQDTATYYYFGKLPNKLSQEKLLIVTFSFRASRRDELKKAFSSLLLPQTLFSSKILENFEFIFLYKQTQLFFLSFQIYSLKISNK